MTGSARRRNHARRRHGRLRRWLHVHRNQRRLRRWLLAVPAAFVLLTTAPVLVLRWLPPPASAVIVQRSIAEGRKQYVHWVDLEDIAPHVALAVVAAEDQKFPVHSGFDLQAIRKAIDDNARGGRLRGASTLTQQVARNLFLWQGRSYLRKGLEAWFTVLIELFWSKQRILEVYLNIAETGTQTFGVEAAARRFLHTTGAGVTREQAALIAAVLPAPRRMRIDAPSSYVQERRQQILQQMDQLGDGYLARVLR
jgi:monofunctional biosynthetic peptidoglycan transglycosylase